MAEMNGRNAEKENKVKKEKKQYYFDYTLLFALLLLIGFGLIMIYSVSSYSAYLNYNGNAAFFLQKQLKAVGVGFVLMIVTTLVDYRFWYRFAGWGYIVAAILIIMVPFFGDESHGATRWLIIPGINISIQPAEIAKACVILLLAKMMYVMGEEVHTFKGLLKLVLLPGLMFIGIWQLTNNLSSALIILGIAGFMIFVITKNYRWYMAGGVVGIIGVIALRSYLAKAVIDESMGFRSKRLIAWINPELYPDKEGFQTLQSLYAIGSGGLVGKGLGQSMQKLGFIPEAQNDMIFSVICEELGLFGALIIIVTFLILLWRMMIIANSSLDLFGALLVVGVMAHIAIQVILNIAVVTNTVPNTGISLPFISYGGTSLSMLMAEVGLVFSVGLRIYHKD